MPVQNLCRICGQIDQHCVCIFTENGSNGDLDMKIKKCLHHLKVEENDGKPQQICNICSTKLDEFSEFIDKSREVDEQFEDNFKDGDNTENPGNSDELPRVRSSDIICDTPKEKGSRHSGTENFLSRTGNDHACYYNCFQSQPIILNSNFNHALEEIIDIIDLHNDNDSERDEHTPNNENNIENHHHDSLGNSSSAEVHSEPKLTKKNDRKNRKKLPKKRRKLLYFCPNCDQLYRRNRYKKYSHFRIGIKPFTCKSCQMYSIKKNLMKYVQNVNKIPVTSKKFNKFKFLLRNTLKPRYSNNKCKQYTCRYGNCKKTFSSRKNLLEHYASHFPDKANIGETNIPICDSCKKKLKIKNREKSSNICMQCGICSKKFKYQNNRSIRNTPTKTSIQDNSVKEASAPSCPVEV